MKPTRYASYQPLLKALAQASIAARPADWREGELWVRQDGATLSCRLRQAPGEDGVEAPARVLEQASELARALARDGLPWVAWRIGFFRKPVGWGVRVHITPNPGAAELDLTPGQAAAEPSAAPAHEAAPGPVPAQSAAPEARRAGGAPPRVCPHCHRPGLRLRLRDAGVDHCQCEYCGYKLSMMAPPQEFEDSAYHRKPNWAETEAPHAAEPTLMPDGAICGPGYTVRLRSPETLLYEAGNTQVPVRIVLDVARGVRVLEAERLSTVDTPFGARMLTPREHQSILQHLRQAVHLLPGRYLVE